ELAVLAGALEDAAGGVPGVVLVGAEAGGGEARLVDGFAAGGGGGGRGGGGGGVGGGGGGVSGWGVCWGGRRWGPGPGGRAGVGGVGLWAAGALGSWPGCYQDSAPRPRTGTRTWPGPGCLSYCWPCCRLWRSSCRWCLWWRMCTGPTALPVTCWAFWLAI